MWVWNLAALMLRSRKSWLRMVPMAVALLIMTVSLGVNRSINLSPEQSVTSTLGAADGLVSPGFSVLAGSVKWKPLYALTAGRYLYRLKSAISKD